MPVPPPDLNRAFIEQLALGFPDQDLLRQAFEYDPGDVRGTASASTNHRTGLQFHPFVQKAMLAEQQAGRSHRVTARARPLHRALPKWINCRTRPLSRTREHSTGSHDSVVANNVQAVKVHTGATPRAASSQLIHRRRHRVQQVGLRCL